VIEVNNHSDAVFTNIKLEKYKVEPFNNQPIILPEMKLSSRQRWTHTFKQITENELFVLDLKRGATNKL